MKTQIESQKFRRLVLDSITVIYQELGCLRQLELAEQWKKFVSRALEEENVGYRLDDECGVHYFVDEEFERNRASTLSLIEDPKYVSVRTAFDDAYRHLDSDPMDTKAASRSMFEALEILVKQMVDTKNLNQWVVKNKLKALCLTGFSNEETARTVSSEFFDGFAHWVHGLHNYRHGQESVDPVAPSEELAIYILSSGSAFLRWLVQINNNLNNKIVGATLLDRN